MAKIYKTARGKTVDMATFLAKNEEVRAIGNMNVNARGDELDSNNRPIKSRQQTVQAYYRKQVSTPPAEEDLLPEQKSQVTRLQADDTPVETKAEAKPTVEAKAEPEIEFPADVLADDEIEEELVEATEDPTLDAIKRLDAITPDAEVKLEDTVSEIVQDSKPKGLAGAIQKVKDSKKD